MKNAVALGCANKTRDEVVCGGRNDVFGGALLDDFRTLTQNHHLVGHEERLIDVVSDEHHGFVQPRLQIE